MIDLIDLIDEWLMDDEKEANGNCVNYAIIIIILMRASETQRLCRQFLSLSVCVKIHILNSQFPQLLYPLKHNKQLQQQPKLEKNR